MKFVVTCKSGFEVEAEWYHPQRMASHRIQIQYCKGHTQAIASSPLGYWIDVDIVTCEKGEHNG